jgi:hypothetical protein
MSEESTCIAPVCSRSILAVSRRIHFGKGTPRFWRRIPDPKRFSGVIIQGPSVPLRLAPKVIRLGALFRVPASRFGNWALDCVSGSNGQEWAANVDLSGSSSNSLTAALRDRKAFGENIDGFWGVVPIQPVLDSSEGDSAISPWNPSNERH